MKASRVALVALGLGLGGYGLFLAVTTLAPTQLLALAVWLAATVAVHDGILAPMTSALHARWWRTADRRPVAATVVGQVGFVIGAVLSLFVLPEIWAQHRGSANPTILLGDYALRLLLVWGAVGLVVLVTWRLAVRRSRR